MQEMKDAIEEFHQDAARASFMNEVRIVRSRQASLSHVLGGNPAALREHLNTFVAAPGDDAAAVGPGAAAGAAIESTSSRDCAQLIASGPCPNFQALRTITELNKLSDFMGCKCEADVKVVSPSGRARDTPPSMHMLQRCAGTRALWCRLGSCTCARSGALDSLSLALSITSCVEHLFRFASLNHDARLSRTVWRS